MRSKFLLVAFALLTVIAWSYMQSTSQQNAITTVTPQKEYFAQAQLVTESLFENDMPWVFKAFAYQPIMRLIYEIPWQDIPNDVPYVWLNVTIPDEAINRIAKIINKITTDHNNPNWVSSAMPYQVVWAKRKSVGNWEFYPVRSIMIAKTGPYGIPKEIHVQVDNIEDRKYLVVIIPTPYTINFEDMIGPIPQSGQFYSWTINSADKASVRFEKDTPFAGLQDDNRVLYIAPRGHVWMSKDINFDLIPSKKYPVSVMAYVDTSWTDAFNNRHYGAGLLMLILKGITNTGSTKYIIIAYKINHRNPDVIAEEPGAAFENLYGTGVDYCLVKRMDVTSPGDVGINDKFDLWEIIYNNCGADYYQITKIGQITIYAKTYGDGRMIVQDIMFGHPDFLNVTKT